jgi:hypothetical protein
MMKNTYNGWTNKQTWNLSIRYEEIFASLVEESKFEDVDCLADAFECLVDELEFEGVKENSLAYDALGAYLSEVNWEEIASHYFKEELSEHDRDIMQQIADSLASK